MPKKNGQFAEFFENMKHAVKQCYQTGQFKYVCRTKIGKKSQNSYVTIFKQCITGKSFSNSL